MRKEIEQAKELGAVRVCNYYIDKKAIFSYSLQRGDEKEIFSAHFFNEDGLEVAYFINSTVDFFGLTILDKPRSWGEEIFKRNNYSFSNI